MLATRSAIAVALWRYRSAGVWTVERRPRTGLPAALDAFLRAKRQAWIGRRACSDRVNSTRSLRGSGVRNRLGERSVHAQPSNWSRRSNGSGGARLSTSPSASAIAADDFAQLSISDQDSTI
jgi:hypothetical protein